MDGRLQEIHRLLKNRACHVGEERATWHA